VLCNRRYYHRRFHTVEGQLGDFNTKGEVTAAVHEVYLTGQGGRCKSTVLKIAEALRSKTGDAKATDADEVTSLCDAETDGSDSDFVAEEAEAGEADSDASFPTRCHPSTIRCPEGSTIALLMTELR
jgi:hypothetical protein